MSTGKSLSAEEEQTEVLAVIPSIGGPGFGAVAELQRNLEGIESVSCVVVSNSHSLTEYLRSLSVSMVSDGVNGGFGRSVQVGAGTDRAWGWLLIVNDDISLDTKTFESAVGRYLRNPSGLREIVYFDEDKARLLPRRWEVFLQVSLIGKVLENLRKREVVPESNSYRSFSCVAISRELYDLSRGFDEDLLFTYEDADFVARARKLGAVQRVAANSGVTHLHSVSSGKHVDKVLPVATYSAARYLDKRGGSLTVNTVIIILALLLRLALVPITRAPKNKHLSGICHSALAVIRRSHLRPQLPHYSKL